MRLRLSQVLPLAIGSLFFTSVVAHAITTDITSPIGNLVEGDDPYWATKGYRLTPSQDIQMTALEWWLTLPVGATVEARIYETATMTLVASGTAAVGDGTEQWYHSDISYTLQAGTQYAVAMYHSAASTGTFDRMNGANADFDVPPYFTGVRSVSNNAGAQSDVFPNGNNTWGPFMQVIHGNCGDLVIQMGEVCDDGNVLDGDGCSADCTSDETCGNGIADLPVGEQCDDGNFVDGDGCSADCSSDETCGNGVLDVITGEICDDGNVMSTDGCSDDCLSDETCGNGYVDVLLGELCDDGNVVDGDGCSADCSSNEMCGNDIIDVGVGEVCDDGNMSGGDGCSPDCLSDESCGNGYVDTVVGEACDDGNMVGGDGCSASCGSDESCGNGILDREVGEVCDDLNAEGGDGCSADCLSDETCGNGYVDTAAGEACDDGDVNDPAGPCGTDCQLVDDSGTGSTGADTDVGSDGSGDGSSGAPPDDPTTGFPVTATGDSSGGGGVDTDGSGGASDDPGGCACTTSPAAPTGAPWSLLGLLGLGAIRRRSR